jgi:hypothetical protein
VVGQVRAGLAAAGLDPGDFPGLRAGIDAAGRPMVIVGTMSLRAARRLAELLHGMPNPPSGGASRAA